jgi:hypothetical protein
MPPSPCAMTFNWCPDGHGRQGDQLHQENNLSEDYNIPQLITEVFRVYMVPTPGQSMFRSEHTNARDEGTHFLSHSPAWQVVTAMSSENRHIARRLFSISATGAEMAISLSAYKPHSYNKTLTATEVQGWNPNWMPYKFLEYQPIRNKKQ